MKFVGGETAALSRVYEYFWKKDLLKVYKETRNGMLGLDYSTKFSPWLAFGSLSPRLIVNKFAFIIQYIGIKNYLLVTIKDAV
ncbi:hypothetical protein HN51_063195 [Arachis hypogaea]